MKLDVLINCPVVERSNPVATLLRHDLWGNKNKTLLQTHTQTNTNSKKKRGGVSHPKTKASAAAQQLPANTTPLSH
jgi:hypothetical protein